MNRRKSPLPLQDEIFVEKPLRIAMWSGPRNVSTALLRAWGNRSDTFVCDEPFYAHYLRETGAPHPGADEVISDQENDWQKVVEFLLGPVPTGGAIFYQKHMAHHLLPNMGREWLAHLTHCFLIRSPHDMLLSLDQKLSRPLLTDTGLPQQVEIFEDVRRRTGEVPPVIDSKDLLEDPEGILTLLCEALGVPFTDGMLSWAPGRRETDGVWAKYWYDSVEQSTGFQPYRPKDQALPDHLEELFADAQECYEVLYGCRLKT